MIDIMSICSWFGAHQSGIAQWIVGSGAGIVLGGIFTYSFTRRIENLKRPNLIMAEGKPWPMPAIPQRGRPSGLFIYVKVTNPPNQGRFRAWVPKDTAYECYPTIEFLRDTNGKLNLECSLVGRWDRAPEPTTMSIYLYTPTGLAEVGALKDDLRLRPDQPSQFVNIYPGKTESLAIAVKLDEDTESYGWSNESYDHRYRHPNYLLEGERYLVRVTIETMGIKKTDVFRLHNGATRDAFSLQVVDAKTRESALTHELL